jgi:hypothetical protein
MGPEIDLFDHFQTQIPMIVVCCVCLHHATKALAIDRRTARRLFAVSAFLFAFIGVFPALEFYCDFRFRLDGDISKWPIRIFLLRALSSLALAISIWLLLRIPTSNEIRDLDDALPEGHSPCIKSQMGETASDAIHANDRNP